MKHTISILLAAAAILTVLTGCRAAGKQSATVSENENGTVLTVRIVNQSAVNLHSIAASYSANGETLGSKVCDRIEGNAAPVEYEFEFLPDELPADPMDTFRLDVFATEKAGADYSACGSATIESPQTGTVYTLTLSGDSLPGLALFSEEKTVVTSSPVEAEPSDLSADSLVGPWHLADDTDLEALSEVFPGAAEFGSGMEIRSDGGISWYIGADGATGTYTAEGNTLTAQVAGELDGAAYHITLTRPEAEKLAMTFKDTALVWVSGDGGSLRGED